MSAVWGVPFEKMTSPEVIDWVGTFFERNNLSPFRADSYDKARRALDANYTVLGTVPGALLLASEKLAMSIENSDLNDREVRQNINRRLADIQRATNPRMK